jgi:hypothetical protein
MRQLLLLAGLLQAGIAVADDNNGAGVEIDGMTSKVPASWVKESPVSTMRYAQFKLPKAEGDKEDGELVIFKGIGGSADANIKRWKDQFVPPRGKSIDDVSKVSDLKIAGGDAKMVEIEGTYKYNPAPFNPKSKTVDKPGYRLIGIQFEGPKDVYQIRLTGPAKTVEKHRAGFDEWLKGYKK